MSQEPSALTVFGYGSLIFKPPPHVISSQPGFLKGYVRRQVGFMTDEGLGAISVQNPGRVVTLIHADEWARFSPVNPFPEGDIVWGIAYTIDPQRREEVQSYLDYREKNGYTMDVTDVWAFVDGEEQVVIPQAIVYVGRPDNPAFVGNEPLDRLANHIWRSEGPSGRNKDYMYNLATAVRSLAPESRDSHLEALETRLHKLDMDGAL